MYHQRLVSQRLGEILFVMGLFTTIFESDVHSIGISNIFMFLYSPRYMQRFDENDKTRFESIKIRIASQSRDIVSVVGIR